VTMKLKLSKPTQKNAKTEPEEFQLSKTGLFVDIEMPYIGASPDGIIKCKCHGRGTLEVKFPFCYKDKLPNEERTNFCMIKIEGNWKLKREHANYYHNCMSARLCMVTSLFSPKKELSLKELKGTPHLWMHRRKM